MALLVLGTAACGFVGQTCPGPRQFYLTRSSVQGNQVLTSCAAGFHMASRFEIANLSGVVYDSKRGASSADSVWTAERGGNLLVVRTLGVDPHRRRCPLHPPRGRGRVGIDQLRRVVEQQP